MRTEYMLVPVAKCGWWWEGFDRTVTAEEECRPRSARGDQCDGCLGDGRRVLLDQALEESL